MIFYMLQSKKFNFMFSLTGASILVLSFNAVDCTSGRNYVKHINFVRSTEGTAYSRRSDNV